MNNLLRFKLYIFMSILFLSPVSFARESLSDLRNEITTLTEQLTVLQNRLATVENLPPARNNMRRASYDHEDGLVTFVLDSPIDLFECAFTIGTDVLGVPGIAYANSFEEIGLTNGRAYTVPFYIYPLGMARFVPLTVRIELDCINPNQSGHSFVTFGPTQF